MTSRSGKILKWEEKILKWEKGEKRGKKRWKTWKKGKMKKGKKGKREKGKKGGKKKGEKKEKKTKKGKHPTAPKHHPRTRTKPHPQGRLLSFMLYRKTSVFRDLLTFSAGKLRHTPTAYSGQIGHGNLHRLSLFKNDLLCATIQFRALFSFGGGVFFVINCGKWVSSGNVNFCLSPAAISTTFPQTEKQETQQAEIRSRNTLNFTIGKRCFDVWWWRLFCPFHDPGSLSP